MDAKQVHQRIARPGRTTVASEMDREISHPPMTTSTTTAQPQIHTRDQAVPMQTPKRKAMDFAEDRTSERFSPAPTRKRASRACDNCKVKRWKCEGKIDTDDTCTACRNASVPCTYVQPARKRGPTVGFRERQREEREQRKTDAAVMIDSLEASSPGREGSDDIDETEQGFREASAASRDEVDSRTGRAKVVQPHAAQDHRPHSGPSRSPTRPHTRVPHQTAVPLMGLPRAMVDGLLGVYFTHVHNVWPLIYKSSFSPHTASPLLLLSMLAISACIAPPSLAYGYDAAKLYRMAESALHHRRDNGIDIIQAVVLLSLRQTGCGDKGSAFIYAGRACAMVLNSGLNLARKHVSPDSPEEQTHSRVFWNCYVLDKTLAEETGRSFLLPYRRCSTPFPSTTEIDELESWPPASFSSAPLPRSVRGLVPRRGHVISCFVWTCRLAKIVEEILDLECVDAIAEDEWDRQFRERGEAKRGLLSEAQEAERISEQLKLWGEMLPRNLRIDEKLSPLPHHAISLAWHTTSTIMLHSRYVTQIPRALPRPTSPNNDSGIEVVADSHDICTAAAAETVDMMRLLDKHGLMEQLSSDIIHILSLVTLFLAFDSTSPDVQIATRAKADFQQSCTWLRALTSSWPAASAHKLFFEAVIQGGMKLADTEAGNDDRASPLQSTTAVSPGLSGGLQAVRRHLSVSTASKPPVLPDPAAGAMLTLSPSTTSAPNLAIGQMDITGNAAGAGAGGMMLLPHIYWNQLSTAGATTQNPLLGLDIDHDYGTKWSMGIDDKGMDLQTSSVMRNGMIGGSGGMMGMGGFDDFSFGLSSYAQGQRSQVGFQAAPIRSAAQAQTQVAGQAQGQMQSRHGDSASFDAISPTCNTLTADQLYPDGQLEQSNARAGSSNANERYNNMQNENDPWLSPSDQWSGYNLPNATADADSTANAGTNGSTMFNFNGTNGGPSGAANADINAAALLKQDQSAITAALMKFMADMRNTNTAGQ